MNLQTMRNRVYIHTRDFKRERFDPLLIDRLLSEAQEEFNAQTKIYRTSADLTTTNGVADLITGTTAGQLTKIEITNGGSGYSANQALTISGNAVATAIVADGRVVQVVITDPGKGYTSAPTVTLAAPASGTAATFVATVATQDIPSIQGEILRVEDRGATPHTALVRTSEEALDVLVGPAWRGNAVGTPQFYLRGKGGNWYAGTSDNTSSNYNGYEALTIYPLVNSRTIRVWYIKRPPDLIGDYDTPVVPEHYHMALVWHATSTLLAESMAEGDNAKAQQAAARYQEFVKRGIEEADQSLRWR